MSCRCVPRDRGQRAQCLNLRLADCGDRLREAGDAQETGRLNLLVCGKVCVTVSSRQHPSPLIRDCYGTAGNVALTHEVVHHAIVGDESLVSQSVCPVETSCGALSLW